MNGLSSIVGQTRAVEILRSAVRAGKVHHAYLFEGPEGVGKATTARALAQALNCERREPSGCGACDACLKIDAGTHPDLLLFDMTPKGLTERVRELIGVVGYRPHEGRARLVLLDPADDLAGAQDKAEPANVLLKTLEEPPADTHFVLVTAQPRRLPVTVRSRCQRIRFQPLDDAAVEAQLVNTHGVGLAQARALAAQAGGSLGRALAELGAGEPDGALSPREQAEALLQAARKGDPRALFTAAGELDREQAEAALGYLWTVLRDALLGAEGLGGGRVSPARAELAAQWLGDRTPSALLRALTATQEALVSLRGNVAPALVLEHLLLGLQPPAAARAS